jgi:hypothetical protein
VLYADGSDECQHPGYVCRREGVARHRYGRVISYVQVSYAAFDDGRWVTIGLGSAAGADICAAQPLDNAVSPDGEAPSAVRVIAECDLAPADLVQAHADLRTQAQG